MGLKPEGPPWLGHVEGLPYRLAAARPGGTWAGHVLQFPEAGQSRCSRGVECRLHTWPRIQGWRGEHTAEASHREEP